MENQQLKNILIEELGKMPFKDKKLIKEKGSIPDALLEKLILRNKKKKRFSTSMLIVLLSLLTISLLLNYFIKEEGLSLMLFGVVILMQVPQLIFHSDYKDSSKKELIFKLLKTLNEEEKN